MEPWRSSTTAITPSRFRNAQARRTTRSSTGSSRQPPPGSPPSPDATNPGFAASYAALPARGMGGLHEPRARGAVYGVRNPGFAAFGSAGWGEVAGGADLALARLEDPDGALLPLQRTVEVDAIGGEAVDQRSNDLSMGDDHR